MALPAWSDAFWSNWALVLVGIAASYLALRSLRVIKTQTRHIEQQVKEMQASSKQTDKLIEQATKQAEAAKDAANSALVNAQAVVNSERAWVMARIEHSPLAGARYLGSRPPDCEDTTMSIRLWTKNDGKTPAWITEKRACFVIKDLHSRLPEKPDSESMEIIQPTPEPLAVGESTYLDVALTSVGRQGFDEMGLIYGRIQYRDVFADNRETFFGYRVTLGDEFERLSSYPEYNKNT